MFLKKTLQNLKNQPFFYSGKYNHKLGFYHILFIFSSFVYLKFVLVWCLILLADFVLEFRFEYLWPFWLLIRSVCDSFKYQGLVRHLIILLRENRLGSTLYFFSSFVYAMGLYRYTTNFSHEIMNGNLHHILLIKLCCKLYPVMIPIESLYIYFMEVLLQYILG